MPMRNGDDCIGAQTEILNLDLCYTLNKHTHAGEEKEQLTSNLKITQTGN
jgi:hypothetical protein